MAVVFVQVAAVISSDEPSAAIAFVWAVFPNGVAPAATEPTPNVCVVLVFRITSQYTPGPRYAPGVAAFDARADAAPGVNDHVPVSPAIWLIDAVPLRRSSYSPHSAVRKFAVSR